ncbi:hypothetical protein DFH09DRAFT_1361026 [Mycena vulgaris]|nr:hypothetical protein DFH09DRAFT_1361026 [Mycena vulgaris]
MASSNPNKQSQPHPAPVLAMRRRTILACANCRKRKIRCITTEQPPKTPCARCVKKHLPCEYVAAAEPEYSPEFPVSDLPYGGAPSAPTPPTFHGGRGAAPPLPYTGPPPVSMTPTGWRYSPPSHPVTAPGFNPGSANPHSPPQFNQQYYSAAQPNARHDPRQHPNRGSTPRPPFMQQQQQPGDYPGFDYSQWVNDYDGAPGPSSRDLPNNKPFSPQGQRLASAQPAPTENPEDGHQQNLIFALRAILRALATPGPTARTAFLLLSRTALEGPESFCDHYVELGQTLANRPRG